MVSIFVVAMNRVYILICFLMLAATAVGKVIVGADREDVWVPALEGKRVALLSNHTGLLSSGEHVADAMLRRGINVVTLMSPEHGFGEMPMPESM